MNYYRVGLFLFVLFGGGTVFVVCFCVVVVFLCVVVVVFFVVFVFVLFLLCVF